MAADDDKTKKLAAAIRSATESDEHDLAHFGPDACDALATGAFERPLPLKDMIRVSFVVGGGKKVRQKYNDGLPTMLRGSLERVGYKEDRGASLSNECAGLFKYQHNTDTDLKVIHVFPRIDPSAAAAASSGEGEDALTPEQLITFSEMRTFQRMIAAKTPSFTQRKRALDVIKAARAELVASEEKLANMQPLSDGEQSRYDTLDATALEEKQAWLSKAMEEMVSSGQLTSAEVEMVAQQLDAKRETIETQLADADATGKAKKAEKLRALLEEVDARSAAVREIKPIRRRVKFEAEIAAVQKKLAELAKLEKSKVVLPLAEVQKLNAKPKLLDDLAAMQAESAGWFSA